MANERRKRQAFLGGLVEDNPLLINAVALNSAALAAIVGGVGSTEHVAVMIDPDGFGGAPEIAYITALTAGATSCTIARGQEGTSARQHERDTVWLHGPTPKDADGAGGGVGLIGLKSYNPGTAADISTTSATFADVDATNLAVAFTVPPSGQVLVRLTGYAYVTNSSAIAWNLREGSADVAGTSFEVVFSGLNPSQVNLRCSSAVVVSGLTPGAAKTYKWGHARTSGTGAAHTYYGGASIPGPAVMEVWAVNI